MKDEPVDVIPPLRTLVVETLLVAEVFATLAPDTVVLPVVAPAPVPFGAVRTANILPWFVRM